jgi:hypothetical protein
MQGNRESKKEVAMNSGNPDETGAEKTLEFFCRHLVALCVTYRPIKNGMPIEQQQFFACPGVVICIRGFCSFLTAGHALKDLNTHLERGDIVVDSAVLADTFGPDAISGIPIPFDLLNEPRFFIDNEEEGLDFGLVALRPYYVALLVKHGIKALFEENWINQHRVEFDAYTMLGLPEEFVTYEQDGAVGIVSPTMIGVKALDNPPEGANPTTYPRFIGQLHEGLPLSSIVGMSGGPIFGFRYGPPMSYWVVAIQSSWLQSQRIVFGCPLPVLAELLATWIDDLSSKGEFQTFGAEKQNEGPQEQA